MCVLGDFSAVSAARERRRALRRMTGRLACCTLILVQPEADVPRWSVCPARSVVISGYVRIRHPLLDAFLRMRAYSECSREPGRV
jgi:hypothetical protein